MSVDSSLLDIESNELDYEKLFLDSLQHEPESSDMFKPATFLQVTPKPGFCIKVKDEENKKVFINICQADNVPKPEEISDEKLMELLDSEVPTDYRIPMSLGESHPELDKSGQACTVYDVVINPKFFEKIQKNELFRVFMISISMEGLEEKYKMKLKRNSWVILKNKKFMGSIAPQNIRNKSKSLISEVFDNVGSKSSPQPAAPSTPLIKEISSHAVQHTGEKPLYKLLKDPAQGHPEFMVAEINLPKIKIATSLILNIGEDRLLLETRSDVYLLDIYFPYNIIQENCGAQFNRKTKLLTVTMPVQPQNYVTT
ncbi:PIH1 domain-containing protein 1 [Octopus bimaculoides]|uniref:PIH1 domain-containing protein 1 n=1 Tax=Octopus bimaculoides TaxID=37653 RepID=A0A0L8HSK6_OCTBM|nr:PIH1 domain-containing protein 1 [Octopus bimaculoides]|eukprot:XP_014769704.1 PREDICTED: PIH1 domain-containing protein 1-like [Octopus bimaculoides]